MPQLTAQLRTPWGLASALWGEAVATPWGLATQLWSTGGAYTPPPAPPGGVPAVPSNAAAITVPAGRSFDLVRSLQVTDLRNGQPLPVVRVTIATDRDSAFWTLRASGSPELLPLLSTGEQPARVRVAINGAEWDFVLEGVNRTRRNAGTDVAVEGRSLSAAAGTPYEAERLWALEGDTTGGQLAAAANLFTELDVQFELDDWPVPAGVFSYTGTPLGVVQRVAEAAGGMVISRRVGYGVAVRPRYRLLPNEWGEVSPDLELALDLVETDGFRVADQPPYDGVVVSGQRGGVAGLVRLAGTAGAFQAPMVTDVLITDVVAARQRGQAVLGRGGAQKEWTLSMPVPVVGGTAVVPDPGWLVRVMDAPPWVGMVTSVQVDATFDAAQLSLGVEQHTAAVPGTVVEPPPTVPPLSFVGPIANITVAPGGTVNVSLASNWVNGVNPRVYSLRSGLLPAWLSFNALTAQLSGTAPAEEGETQLALRATDAVNSTADSNEFTVAVEAPAASVVAVSLARFDGTNGQTVGIADAGTSGGTWSGVGLSLSSATPFAGATALRVASNDVGMGHNPASAAVIAAGVPFTLEWQVYVPPVADPFEALDTLVLESAVMGGQDFETELYATGDAGVGLMVFQGPGGAFDAVNFANGTYVHQAFSVDSAGTLRFWLNGALVGTHAGAVTAAVSYASTRLRSNHPTGVFIDNYRLRTGFAYTAPFTPDATI